VLFAALAADRAHPVNRTLARQSHIPNACKCPPP
jgi:hypothetical protein